MSYVYCAYLSFSDVVAPIGAAAHHVEEGRFLLMSTGSICAFFDTVIAFTMGPALLWGAQVRRLGTSTASTKAASASAYASESASAAAAVVDSMIWSVSEL